MTLDGIIVQLARKEEIGGFIEGGNYFSYFILLWGNFFLVF